MTSDVNARIRALCQQIADEKDSQHFLRLVQELNDLLENHGRRLRPTEKGKGRFTDFASQD